MIKNSDLLNVTAFLSALFHVVVILGISFKLPELRESSNLDNTLDVVLINQSNDEVPDSAETVSTQNNDGGGVDDQEATSPLKYTLKNPAPIESFKHSSQQQISTTIETEQLTSAKTNNLQIEKKQVTETKLESQPSTEGEHTFNTKSQRKLEQERLIAKLKESINNYQKRPKKEFLSPRTKLHEAAKYLDKWRKKVEAIGNANYPIQAKAKGLYGTLILTVEINRNGSINNIVVNHPSPHKLLDQAAIRFIRKAAPFEPFPSDIDKSTDILVISRSFHFLNNNRLTSTGVE